MKARLAVLMMALALAFTGCVIPPREGENVVVWLVEGSTPATLREYLVQQFAITNGGNLVINQMPADAIIARAFEARSGEFDRPDVVEIPSYATSTLVANQAFADISPMASDVQARKLVPSLVELGVLKKRNYAYPYLFTTRYLYYRKDIYALAEIEEPPATLNEFQEAAIKIAEDNPRKIKDFSGIYLADQDWHDALGWIYANGGALARYRAGDRWESTLSEPETVAGLEQLQELHAKANKGTWGDPINRPWIYLNEVDWKYDAFGGYIDTTVSAATIMGNDSMRARLGDRVRSKTGARVRQWNEEEFGIFPLPGQDGNPAPTHVRGSCLAILSQSPRQKGARQFLEIIYSPEFQKMLALNGKTPANKDYWSMLGSGEFASTTIAVSQSAQPTPAAPGWLYIEQSGKLEEFFTRVMRGGDIDKLTRQYDKEFDEMLNSIHPPIEEE
ncbi:MAG: extracellular solute-binding protein [Propionibacteriaceae bacterium]|nr:extracellular solute-binding protein [Propionibacteriaceae bacterium]